MAVIFGPSQWQLNVQVAATALGSSIAGGLLICKNGGVGWIISPSSTQVTRTWDFRNDAVTTAQTNASFGDWFVPSSSQLQNPGFVCRTYWDSYPPNIFFWSNTEVNAGMASLVSFNNGGATTHGSPNKFLNCPVRAFRCVTY